MDIFNSKERKIVCVENDDAGAFGCNGTGHMLTVGAVYTVIDVEVHSWHTIVELKEFPGVGFNSVLFEEIEN